MPHLLIREFKMHLLLQAHRGTLSTLKYINDFSGTFIKILVEGKATSSSSVTNWYWLSRVHIVEIQGT